MRWPKTRWTAAIFRLIVIDFGALLLKASCGALLPSLLVFLKRPFSYPPDEIYEGTLHNGWLLLNKKLKRYLWHAAFWWRIPPSSAGGIVCTDDGGNPFRSAVTQWWSMKPSLPCTCAAICSCNGDNRIGRCGNVELTSFSFDNCPGYAAPLWV